MALEARDLVKSPNKESGTAAENRMKTQWLTEIVNAGSSCYLRIFHCYVIQPCKPTTHKSTCWNDPGIVYLKEENRNVLGVSTLTKSLLGSMYVVLVRKRCTHCQWRRRELLGTSETAGLWSRRSDPRQTWTANNNVFRNWCQSSDNYHCT